MVGLVLRRLALIPVALLLVNFFGFAYGHLVGGATGSLSATYATYLAGVLRLDLGAMPYAAGQDPIADYLARTGIASLGLLLLAFVVSILLGIVLGLRAVRAEPPRILT